MNKRYKLLKDLPQFNAGTEFEEQPDGTLGLAERTHFRLDYVARDFPNWFQPLPQPVEQEWEVKSEPLFITTEYDQCITVRLNASDSAAEAVCDAVEALMGHIHGGDDYHFKRAMEKAAEARQALYEERTDHE